MTKIYAVKASPAGSTREFILAESLKEARRQVRDGSHHGKVRALTYKSLCALEREAAEFKEVHGINLHHQTFQNLFATTGKSPAQLVVGPYDLMMVG